MKRLLYVAPILIDKNNLDGVGKKVLLHAKTFANYYDVDIIYNTKECVILENVKSNSAKRIKSTIKSNRNKVLNEVNKLNTSYDYCYVRYPKADPLLLGMLRKIKKNKTKLVLEIPTYPYDNSHIRSFIELIIKIVDYVFRNKLHKYIDRVITYSNDDEIFGIKTIQTINGVSFSEKNISTTKSHKEKNIINLVAVSSMYIINGYERLIRGLAKYERNDVIFHIVGEGPEIQKYKIIVNENNIKNKVIFYGKKTGRELDEIYNISDVGVNSLAIHRQNLKKESTLKSREYVAHGLPVISSTPIDALVNEDNKKYVYIVSEDETDIDIKSFIKWYKKLIYENNNIKNDIFNSGKKTCEINITLMPVVDFFGDYNENS